MSMRQTISQLAARVEALAGSHANDDVRLALRAMFSGDGFDVATCSEANGRQALRACGIALDLHTRRSPAHDPAVRDAVRDLVAGWPTEWTAEACARATFIAGAVFDAIPPCRTPSWASDSSTSASEATS